MKKGLSLYLLLVQLFLICGSGCRNAGSRDGKNAVTGKKIVDTVKNGVTTKPAGAQKIAFKGIEYHVFIADLRTENIDLHLRNFSDTGQFYTLGALHKYLVSKGGEPLMLTNAGMFMTNYAPLGFFCGDDGKSKVRLNTKQPATTGNFYIQPNGVFYIDAYGVPHIDSTAEFARLLTTGKLVTRKATQSGPMLVINGCINNSFTDGSKNVNIRSGVGVIDSKQVVFAISVQPCNFYEFALLFRDNFQCSNALFLDGAISQMYLKDINTGFQNGRFGPMISVTGK